MAGLGPWDVYYTYDTLYLHLYPAGFGHVGCVVRKCTFSCRRAGSLPIGLCADDTGHCGKSGRLRSSVDDNWKSIHSASELLPS